MNNWITKEKIKRFLKGDEKGISVSVSDIKERSMYYVVTAALRSSANGKTLGKHKRVVVPKAAIGEPKWEEAND